MGPLTSVDSVFIRSQQGHSLREKIELERKWRIKQPTWKDVPLKPAIFSNGTRHQSLGRSLVYIMTMLQYTTGKDLMSLAGSPSILEPIEETV